MKRLLLAAGALILTLGLSGTASAQPAPPATVRAATLGGGADVNPWRPYGYYLWLDGDRVHLRTTDPGGDGSRYTGRIVTDGRIRNVDLFEAEPVDRAVAAGGTLEFVFQTHNHVDGVSFTAAGADRMTFHLYRNGRLISTEHIFLGGAGHHPPGNPFTVFN